DRHENHFLVFEVVQVVHLVLALGVALVAGLAGLVGHFDGRAVVHVLAGAAAADAGPEIIEHVAVEADALVGSEPDDPDARALVLRQQRGADARVGVLGLALELGGDVGRPRRLLFFVRGLIEHGQSHGRNPPVLFGAIYSIFRRTQRLRIVAWPDRKNAALSSSAAR